MRKQRRRSASRYQRICVRHIDNTIPPLSKSELFKHLAIFCGFAARFVSDLVGNPEDRFSHNEAQMCSEEYRFSRAAEHLDLHVLLDVISGSNPKLFCFLFRFKVECMVKIGLYFSKTYEKHKSYINVYCHGNRSGYHLKQYWTVK